MAEEQTPAEKQLWLEKFYIKDVKFVSPDSPERFDSKVNAESQLNVQSVYQEIRDQYVEVALMVRVKAIVQENEIFRIELVQAGVFTLSGFEPEERLYLLGSTCPAMLYAFARQSIAQIVRKSGFRELLLRPLDFDAMYAQNMQERNETAGNA